MKRKVLTSLSILALTGSIVSFAPAHASTTQTQEKHRQHRKHNQRMLKTNQ